MTINRQVIRELKHTYRGSFPNALKRYLIQNYSEESFFNEFGEKALCTKVLKGIRRYDLVAHGLEPSINAMRRNEVQPETSPL